MRQLWSCLGAILTQDGCPVAYASRALTKTERNYAQIEKECVAIVFAAERFEHCILGKDIAQVLSYHKPLMSIFTKPILTSPKRLQRMRLRLQKYPLKVVYKPCPQMFNSDTLSRAALPLRRTQTDTPDYLIFQVQEEERFRQEVEETNQEEAILSQTSISSKYAKKPTKMPPCKCWWLWSQLVGQMTNCRPRFAYASIGLTGMNCLLKMA